MPPARLISVPNELLGHALVHLELRPQQFAPKTPSIGYEMTPKDDSRSCNQQFGEPRLAPLSCTHR